MCDNLSLINPWPELSICSTWACFRIAWNWLGFEDWQWKLQKMMQINNPSRRKFCPRTKPCGRGNSWDAFNPICNPPTKTLQYICKYIQTCTCYIPQAWLCTLVVLSDQGMGQLPLGHFCNRLYSSLEFVLTQLCSILWPFVKKIIIQSNNFLVWGKSTCQPWKRFNRGACVHFSEGKSCVWWVALIFG